MESNQVNSRFKIGDIVYTFKNPSLIYNGICVDFNKIGTIVKIDKTYDEPYNPHFYEDGMNYRVSFGGTDCPNSYNFFNAGRILLVSDITLLERIIYGLDTKED